MTLVDKSKFSTASTSKRVEKPWGFEILFTKEDLPFIGKIAFTKTGARWSLQFHEEKSENICLIIGEGELWLEDEKGEVQKIRMDSLQGYHVQPFQKHRFVAITDCWTVEASTPELGNTVRVEDDYNRDTETEEDRSKR